MLTAIQDFVKDSFEVNDGAALEALRMGELTVWVEQGPEALLAALIRGQPPPELRDAFRDALERIHRSVGRELLLFNGDTHSFECCEGVLRSCLLSDMQPVRNPSCVPALAFLAMLAALAVSSIGFSVYKRHQWNTAVAAVRNHPGFVVTRAQWGWRQSVLEGLRDPLAERPEVVLRSVNIEPTKVEGKWKPFLSLDPEIVLARARRSLEPPEGVQLTLAGDVLEVHGNAPSAWVEKSAQAAVQLPGIREIRFPDLQQWKAMIERQLLNFLEGSSRLEEGELPKVERLAGWIRAALAAAPVRVTITGHADRLGIEASNDRLSLARAQSVMRALTARGIPAVRLDAIGVGESEAGRTVSLRVTGADDHNGARP
jgi:OOP family OmpA-OmpF porin